MIRHPAGHLKPHSSTNRTIHPHGTVVNVRLPQGRCVSGHALRCSPCRRAGSATGGRRVSSRCGWGRGIWRTPPGPGCSTAAAAPMLPTTPNSPLAEAITALDPDVLAVQEVGDPAALQDLANKLDQSSRPVDEDLLGGFWLGLFVGSFDELAGLEHRARADECDEVGCVDGAPAVLGRIRSA
jgi:hypothetical protein